ncbi:MAG: sensor histidine kinase [Halobacteriota archaeon]
MQSRSFLESPAVIAAIYFFFGISWILLTDFLTFNAIEDVQVISQLQVVKGWVFVTLSALLIYGLVWHGYRSHEETAERLDRSIQQSTILHRILRHNLRNICNIIQGNVENLRDQSDNAPPQALVNIEEQTAMLVELSDKTRYLRDIVMDETDRTERIDLVALIEREAARISAIHPHATVRTDLPETVEVEFDARLERAVRELLDNAIAHNDRLEPVVDVRIEPHEFGSVDIVIEDNGPGMPDMERNVLQTGYERPMFHSQGLGLWISRTIVSHNGGRFRITDNVPRGTIIRITIPILSVD